MTTKDPVPYLARIGLSVLKVQAFASCMAPWHVFALVMTSPFFVMFGAAIRMLERVGLNSWIAATVGFAGAMIPGRA